MSSRRKLRLLVLTAAVAVPSVTGAAAIGAGTFTGRSAGASPPAISESTVPVEAGPLIRSVKLQGRVRPAGAVELPAITAPPQGTELAVVTAHPAAVGSTVVDGQVILAVSDRPIFLLRGAITPFRDLKLGDEGPDVEQLNRFLARIDLRALRGGSRNQRYDIHTARAVARLYKKSGYRPLSSAGTPETADPAAPSPGPAQHPERSGASATPGAPDSGPAGEQPPAIVDGGLFPRSELVAVPALPAKLCELSATFGRTIKGSPGKLCFGPSTIVGSAGPQTADAVAAAAAPTSVVELGGRPIRVDVRFSPSSGNVQAEDPAGEKSGGSTGDAQAEAEIAFEARPRTTIRRVTGEVSITVELERSPASSLVVPVGALWQRPDGGLAVVVISADGRRREVQVEAAMSTDGRSAITGSDLQAGDQVSLTHGPDPETPR
ncbi:MAG: hypothetical protein QOH84_295 [Kribbellaceae bacterium]|jgi:hypothetical protein|nr:hypothetical protein [Kribbellaceae bacterium]